jgi:hypothetical protein
VRESNRASVSLADGAENVVHGGFDLGKNVTQQQSFRTGLGGDFSHAPRGGEPSVDAGVVHEKVRASREAHKSVCPRVEIAGEDD